MCTITHGSEIVNSIHMEYRPLCSQHNGADVIVWKRSDAEPAAILAHPVVTQLKYDCVSANVKSEKP